MSSERGTNEPGSLVDVQGGGFGQLMTRLGLGGCSSRQIIRRTLFWVIAVWLPPMALAGLGKLFTTDDPRFDIFTDLSFHVRCLIAVPLLLATECRLQQEFALVMPALKAREMLRLRKVEALWRVFAQSRGLQISMFVDPVLLVFSIAIVASRLYIELPIGASSWKTVEALPYVLAREWNQWISLVFYYFLAFRWVWRFVVWSLFLLRVALLNPDLKSLHPDRVGGLAFLVRYHKMFGVASFAISSVASANIASVVLRSGLSIDDFFNPILLYLFVFNAILAVPLFVFTPALIKARNWGLIRYARFGNSYAGEFNRRWLVGNNRSIKQILGTPDVQSLNDLHGSYRSQAQMRISLMDTRTLMANTVFIAAPLLPLVLFKFPAYELMIMVVKYFFKI